MDTGNLIDNVLSGKCCLFLGAGASAGSILENGDSSPLGNKLAQIIYNNFYPTEKYENERLDQISSMISATLGYNKLQEFLYHYFKNIKPTDSLKSLTQFKWSNIYTTNIEQAIEEAYNQEPAKAQELKVIVGPMDVSTENKSVEVNLYKLHGCITRRDQQLVFSLEEYARSKETHLKLFNCLTNDLIEKSIIFIGYSMVDSNFQEVWDTIKKYCSLTKLPNKYYFVGPYLKQPFIDYLKAEGFEVYNQTIEEFSEFLMQKTLGERKTLEQYFVENTKPIKLFERVNIPIQKKYLISNNYEFPAFEIQHSYPNTNGFFKGIEPSWGDIKYSHDATRDLLVDLLEAFENWYGVQMYDLWLITGRAGDGKTTMLKRLAYELSVRVGDSVLYAKSRASLDPQELVQIQKDLKEPLILFIDNITDRLTKVNKLMSYIKVTKSKILIIGGSRSSDWNFYVTDFTLKPIEFKLQKLSDAEIERILSKLEINDSLDYLEQLTPDKRKELFKEKSDRELLVALRESTTNEQFDRIIANEYLTIKSEDAKRAYLFVSLVNQFRYRISQSLLLRVLKTDLNTIRDTVFQFTNDIIFYEDLPDGSDYLLKTRHPVIAEVIIKTFLKDDVRKFEYLQEILEAHIPSDPLERSLVKKIYHHSTIRELFEDVNVGIRCYEFLIQEIPDDFFLLQQKAIFLCDYTEQFKEAREAINQAVELNRHSIILLNTQGTIVLKQALAEDDFDTSKYLLEEGKQLLISTIRKNYRSNSYNYHSLINHLISWYKKFQDGQVLEEIQEIIGEAAKYHPYDHMILTEIGKLDTILNKAESAVHYFNKAIQLNPRNTIAIYLLAKILYTKGKIEEALDVCKKGTEITFENYFLNRLQFEILHRLTSDKEYLKSEYKRFITNEPTDDYLKLVYAGFLYSEMDNECDKFFAEFRKSRDISFGVKYIPQFEINKIINQPKLSEIGVMTKSNPTGFYLSSERFNSATFAFISNKTVNNLRFRQRVTYNYTFNFMGPVAIDGNAL